MNEDDNFQRKDYRVKLYHLESEGAWIDTGTGNLICTYVEELKSPALILTSEDDHQHVLLISKIQLDDIYERQGESIIMWRDKLPGGDEDYAVSFQNTNDCQTIWDAIGEVQNQYLQHSEYGITPNFSKSSSLSSKQYSCDSSSPQMLPTVSITSLHDIKSLIMNISPFDKDSLAARLIGNEYEYLHQLLDLFEMLESIQDVASLNMLAEVWRAILMLNDGNLIHFAISDPFIQVIGVFEYDPALKCRGTHRDFFLHHATLHEVIPLEDENLKSSIHSLYRMKYLKDYLLRPSIDEIGANALMGMMTACAIEICTKVFDGTDYLSKVIDAVVMYSYENQHNIINNSSSDMLATTTSSIDALLSNNRAVNVGDRCYSPSNSTCGVDGDDDDHADDSSSSHDDRQHDAKPSPDEIIKYRISSPAMIEDDEMVMMIEQQAIHPRNLRLEGIRFIRELFFLTRNFHWDRRYDLYSIFIKRYGETFFRFVCEVLNPTLPSRGDPVSDHIERQLVAEVLSYLASICTHEIRRHIISTPFQSLPDHSNTSSSAAIINRHHHHKPASSTSEKLDTSSSFNLLLSMMLSIIDGDDVVVIDHLADVIRLLIEPDASHRIHPPDHNTASADHHTISASSNNNNKQEMEKFLSSYYDYYVHWLLIPFTEPNEAHLPRIINTPSNNHHIRSRLYHNSSPSSVMMMMSQDEIQSAIGASRRSILELFTVCVYRHAYRMKYFVMRSGLLSKFNRFLATLNHPSTASSYRHIQSNIIKFYRAIIASKDEFYYRHIIKLDLLHPLLQTLEKEVMMLHQQQIASTIIASSSGKKISRFQESLIASAIVEVMMFISDTSSTLIVYIVEKLASFTCFHVDDDDKHDDVDNYEMKSSSPKKKMMISSSFVEVFNHLRLKYEEIINPSSSNQHHESSSSDPKDDDHHHRRIYKKRNRDFLEQGKEESYFESDDHDDSNDEHLDDGHQQHPMTSSSTSNQRTDDHDDEPAASNSIKPSPSSSPKDSLQLLADFYADYESDDDIPYINETSSSSSPTAAASSSPSSTSPIVSPRDHDDMISIAEKRRRIAKIRDMVDFGVSGTMPSSSMIRSSPSSSPTHNPSSSISNNMIPLEHTLMNGFRNPPPSSSSSSSSHDNQVHVDGHDFQLPLNLPPVLKPKFEESDDHDLTKDEFLKRAARHTQTRQQHSVPTSSVASSLTNKQKSSPSSQQEADDNDIHHSSSNAANAGRMIKSSSLASLSDITTATSAPIQIHTIATTSSHQPTTSSSDAIYDDVDMTTSDGLTNDMGIATSSTSAAENITSNTMKPVSFSLIKKKR